MARVYGEGTWDEITRKNGKYQRYRVHINGERKAFYGKTKKEALNKYKAYLEERQKSPVKTDRTLRQVAEAMVESRKVQIKPTTYDGYMYEVKRIFDSKIGRLQIATVTPDDLQKHIDAMAKERSYSAIKSHRVVLKMTFDYAVSTGYIASNPMRDVRLPNKANIVKETRQAVFLSTEERHMIESEAANEIYTGNSAKAIVFILHTGLRISELIALTWDDISFQTERMYIRKVETRLSAIVRPHL